MVPGRPPHGPSSRPIPATAQGARRSLPELANASALATATGVVRALLLRLSDDEATFAKRNFRCRREPTTRAHLEHIGKEFIRGYNAGLQYEGAALVAVLDRVSVEFRGFAFEGAAMSACLLDSLIVFG